SSSHGTVENPVRGGAPGFWGFYKEPSKNVPEPKLTLVCISGERLERTSFGNEAFPDLPPDLGALKNEGLDFSHTQQLPGPDYTMVGMVAF
ncbi:phosphoglycerol transferase I, partial [Escherichia coli]|nr:phosphoglycerol transferase I [Escherichia coli]